MQIYLGLKHKTYRYIFTHTHYQADNEIIGFLVYVVIVVLSICDIINFVAVKKKKMLKKIFNIKNIIFLILAFLIMMLVPKMVGLLMVLFASFVLAAALNPYVNKLQEKLSSRILAALSVLTITASVLFALILPILIMGIKEIQLLLTIMPEKITNLYKLVTEFKFYGHTFGEIFPMENIFNSSSDFAQGIVNGSINFTMELFQMLFVSLALLMFIYYILVDKEYLKNKFIEFFPPYLKQKASNILYDITSKVGNYIRAQILSMISVGVMVTIAVAILGIDYPILLGLISGICEIIPLLGPSIAIAVIIMIAYPLGFIKIAIAILLFLIIQQISNYIIRPLLFGKFMQLHPITILVAIFIAEEFFGIWGVILSPAIAATFCVLLDELYLIPINSVELENKIE